MMEQSLLLNATYEPLRVIHWKRAICLVWQAKVDILEEHEREISSVSWQTRIPSVLRLVKMVKVENTLLFLVKQMVLMKKILINQFHQKI